MPPWAKLPPSTVFAVCTTFNYHIGNRVVLWWILTARGSFSCNLAWLWGNFSPFKFYFFHETALQYNCQYKVNMSWFEPAFIQFGFELGTDEIFLSRGIFHLSQVFSELLCIYCPNCIKAGSNQHIFTSELLL